MLERRDPALTQRRAFGGSGAVAPDGLIQKVNALDIDNPSSWAHVAPASAGANQVHDRPIQRSTSAKMAG
jgi:hypothetical protein